MPPPDLNPKLPKSIHVLSEFVDFQPGRRRWIPPALRRRPWRCSRCRCTAGRSLVRIPLPFRLSRTCLRASWPSLVLLKKLMAAAACTSLICSSSMLNLHSLFSGHPTSDGVSFNPAVVERHRPLGGRHHLLLHVLAREVQVVQLRRFASELRNTV